MSPYYGDYASTPTDDIFRLFIHNINRFSASNNDDSKYIEFFTSVTRYRPSVTLLQELGLPWPFVPKHMQLLAMAKKHLAPIDCKLVTAHNENSGVRSRSQWGGTAVLSYGKVCQYAKGTGQDKTGLGRWCWARFQGRNGISLRTVSVYCPCEPETSGDGTMADGAGRVYNQHLKYLNDNDDDRDPRTAFLEDLDKAMAKWLES